MSDTSSVSTPAQAYQEYFGPAIFEPLAEGLVDYAKPAAGERVLDLACGTGIVARQVAPLLGSGGHVVGVDVNPAMIEVARAQPVPEGAPIEWQQGDATALHLPDDTFDLVVCQQGLQFFPDRAAGLREMRRVLDGGGRAVIALWRGLDEHPLYAALTDAEYPHLTVFDETVTRADLEAPFSMGDPAQLRSLLHEAGFVDVDITTHRIEARFPTPERFVERLEFAYAAVIPAFSEDPALFTAYLETITRETRDIVEQYRVGDRIVVPMHAHLIRARG